MLLPRCPTCPSVPALLIIESSRAHLTHVSTLAGPGSARIRSVMRGGQRRCWPSAPVSRCLSATGVGFLGHPVPAGELGLPCGRLTGRLRVRTPTGFPRSTRVRYDRGGCPLNSGTAMLSRLTLSLQPAPAASQRPVLHPAGAVHRRGPRSRSIIRGSLAFTRPVFPLPVAPGWNGSPWASPSSSTPRRCQRRMSKWGRALSTGPELRCRHQVEPPIR
jgi:hypothetical protein